MKAIQKLLLLSVSIIFLVSVVAAQDMKKPTEKAAKDAKPAEKAAKDEKQTEKPAKDATTTADSKTIVDVATSDARFSTLVSLLKAADLVVLLKDPGPYTVFAPTDEAFAKLPPSVLDDLKKDPDKLKALLLYHVVSGKVASNDVKDMEAQTTQGDKVQLAVKKDAKATTVTVNNATIVQADIMASNGVIHAIDNVLIPKTDTTSKKEPQK